MEELAPSRLLLRSLLVALVFAVLLGGAHAPSAGARVGQEPGDQTTVTPRVPTRDIIPAPNEGVAPKDAGDRGGAAQLALVAAIIGGLAVIVVLAVRDSRRASRRLRSRDAPDGERPTAMP